MIFWPTKIFKKKVLSCTKEEIVHRIDYEDSRSIDARYINFNTTEYLQPS